MTTDQLPADLNPVFSTEQRLQARLDKAHKRIGVLTYDVESRDETIRKLRAELETAQGRIDKLLELAEANEDLVRFHDECEKHGVTGDIDSWRVIDTPQFQRVMCDLLYSIDEAGMVRSAEQLMEAAAEDEA